MMLRVLFGLFACANGFLLAPAMRSTMRIPAVTMGVEEAAATCLEEGCELTYVEDLIKELKSEIKEINVSVPLTDRQKYVFATIAQLEGLGADAGKSELEKIISAASRSFSVVDGFDFPGEPLGYTGAPSTMIADKAFDK